MENTISSMVKDVRPLQLLHSPPTVILSGSLFLAVLVSFVKRNRTFVKSLRVSSKAAVAAANTRRDLKFNAERLKSVLEAVPTGIITLNDKFLIESWNKAASQVFHYNEQTIIGRRFLDIIAPEFHHLFSSQENVDLLTHGTNDLERRLELSGVKLDGTTFPIEFAMSEYQFRKSRFYTCIVRDISRRRKISEDLEAARVAADEACQAKGRFLAQMSHEIRTPLGAILGFSDLLINDQCSIQKKHDYADAIRRNGWLLSRIINDILDLSKVEAGRLNIEAELTETEDIFSDVKGFLRLQAKDKGIYLNLDIAENTPVYIYTAPLRLRQIIINLVGNAIKFTDRGGVNVDVKLRTAERLDDYRLEIAVSDSGCGIEETFLKDLFEPFSQAGSFTTAQYHGSTGLGLALSRKIARLLGGDVYLVQSEQGKGSTFVIEINPGLSDVPLTHYSEPGITHGGSASQTFTSASIPGHEQLKGCHILLTEDSPDNQLLIATFLRRAGADVDIANHGRECLQKVAEKHYDIILMDLQMPVMDGYEALNELQSLGFKEPIVALTAHALKEERKRCLGAGFAAHMSKPVDRTLLIETLKGFVRPS